MEVGEPMLYLHRHHILNIYVKPGKVLLRVDTTSEEGFQGERRHFVGLQNYLTLGHVSVRKDEGVNKHISYCQPEQVHCCSYRRKLYVDRMYQLAIHGTFGDTACLCVLCWHRTTL